MRWGNAAADLAQYDAYGEVLDWVNQIYDATRPAPGQPGDERIKGQLVKMARARTYFREPKPDADGNRREGPGEIATREPGASRVDQNSWRDSKRNDDLAGLRD